MRTLIAAAFSALFLFSAVEPAVAKPVIYPARGQSAEQQSKDETECTAWTQQQAGTGSNVSTQTAPQSTQKDRRRLKGAARGAAAGAIIGEVADDEAGKGAAIGAGVGAIAAGRKARKSKEAENQKTQAQQAQQTDVLDRAFAACMEGRGYSVK